MLTILVEDSAQPKRTWGVLAAHQLDMSWHCALTAQKANPIVGCIKRIMACSSREAILPLCTAEASLGVLHPDVESSAQERCGPVSLCPEEGQKNDPRGWTASLWGALPWGLRLFSLEKRRPGGGWVEAFQYLKGNCKKEGDSLAESVVIGQGEMVSN